MEVCVDNLQSIVNAKLGGASRLELCSALSEGGLTPTVGFLRSAKKIVGDEMIVVPLIRLRGGDFTYSEEEIDVMCDDIGTLVDAGADGIVIGCLDQLGNVDVSACKRLIQAAKDSREKQGLSYNIPSKDNSNKSSITSEMGKPFEVTFHRAFDLCRDVDNGVQAIKDLGCKRLLTSGQESSAIGGFRCIKYLVEKHPDLAIMPGGGISEDNLEELLDKTGARSFHASARIRMNCAMTFKRDGCKMGTNSSEDTIMVTSKEKVSKMVEIFTKRLE